MEISFSEYVFASTDVPSVKPMETEVRVGNYYYSVKRLHGTFTETILESIDAACIGGSLDTRKLRDKNKQKNLHIQGCENAIGDHKK